MPVPLSCEEQVTLAKATAVEWITNLPTHVDVQVRGVRLRFLIFQLIDAINAVQASEREQQRVAQVVQRMPDLGLVVRRIEHIRQTPHGLVIEVV